MSASSTLKSEQRFFFSKDAETTFGTGAGAAISHSIKPISGISTYRRGRNMKDNTDQSTGYQGATEMTPLEHFLNPPPIVSYLDARTLNLIMGHFMKLDTVTAAGTGAWAHAHTEGSQGLHPGSFVTAPRLIQGGAATDKTYFGCYIESFEISGGATDFVTISAKIAGSGQKGAIYVGGDGVVPVGEFPAHKVKISLLPIGATMGLSPWGGTYVPPSAQGVFANTLTGSGAVDLSTEGMQSWRLTGSLNIDESSKNRPGITSGAGSYQACPLVGRRTYGLEVTCESTAVIQGLVYNHEDQSIAAQAHYAVMIELLTDKEIGSSGRYSASALVLPLGQLMPIAPSDDQRVNETLSFQAMSPTSGTPTDLFYAFSVDDDSAAYGA